MCTPSPVRAPRSQLKKMHTMVGQAETELRHVVEGQKTWWKARAIDLEAQLRAANAGRHSTRAQRYGTCNAKIRTFRRRRTCYCCELSRRNRARRDKGGSRQLAGESFRCTHLFFSDSQARVVVAPARQVTHCVSQGVRCFRSGCVRQPTRAARRAPIHEARPRGPRSGA